MSKHATFDAYPAASLPLAEATLLTAWRTLERYQDDLVLVGGLAVNYLTRRTATNLPGAITMDVDFGITLGASGGQYGTIQSDLSGLGFKTENRRLVRPFGSMNLYIDFLTEAPPATTGSRMVDDVVASVIPGLNRALECRRLIMVEGRDLYGAPQRCSIPVADIGPLLVMKLNAFGGPTGRRLPKDAYDILLGVTAYLDGAKAAVDAFRREATAGNTGYATALAALMNDFTETDKDGPVRAAEFCPGGPEQRERVRQDLVTVAGFLIGS